MKKIVLALTAVLAFSSCEKTTTPDGPKESIVTGLISEDVTWYSDTVYEMAGKVVVDEGATLTIQPGTVIKGRDGAGSLSTALIVARGGMIDAQGTVDSPIVFTSIYDTGDNLDETDMGLWGGIVILGNAPISADAVPANIEGVPVNDEFGLYGGTDQMDNSGILRYVSIRHAGTLLGDGNELNGLTLGGVGRGTTIDHIEVVGNLDDGIEFFGGCVDASNLLVWAQGDDAFDVDQGWFGTVTNYVGIEGSDSDHALELDGGEGNTNPAFTLEKGTFISSDNLVEFHFRDFALGFVSYDYTVTPANIVADSATSVMIDATVGADLTVFDWTMASERGAL
jgi:hypothetical protein